MIMTNQELQELTEEFFHFMTIDHTVVNNKPYVWDVYISNKGKIIYYLNGMLRITEPDGNPLDEIDNIVRLIGKYRNCITFHNEIEL